MELPPTAYFTTGVNSLPVLLGGVFFASLGAGPLNPIISAIEFERIPVHMRGRVFGAVILPPLLFFAMMIPLGSFFLLLWVTRHVA